MLVAAADWQDVAVAAIAAVPSTIAAVGVWRLSVKTRTTNGRTIGELAEMGAQVAAGNNHRLRALVPGAVLEHRSSVGDADRAADALAADSHAAP